MTAALIMPATVPAAQAPLRVMVVDDSVVVRGLVARWVDEDPELKVVASLRTGREAVDQLEKADPDVVLLDIEMPVLDGLSALPLLLEKKRNLIVIMVSTLTRRHAETSLRALSLGASDYIAKPETNRGVTTSLTFRVELLDKIRHLGARRRRRAAAAAAPMAGRDAAAHTPSAAVARALPDRGMAASGAASADLQLRPFSPVVPRVLLIGSSTGGPQALMALMGKLGQTPLRTPVLITQHMPPTFTTIMAEHLARASGRPAHEPQDGEPIVPGTIYVAPGGRHMRVAGTKGQPVIALDDGPPVNFCKPAVDPLFASAVEQWGNAILALILTGMGSDGTHGARAVAAAGGSVIAQDEASSVVWGMPGSAAHAGVCSAVLPLDQIAAKVMRLMSGDRS